MPLDFAGTAPLHSMIGQWVPSASSDPTPAGDSQLDLFGPRESPAPHLQSGPSVPPPTASPGVLDPSYGISGRYNLQPALPSISCWIDPGNTDVEINGQSFRLAAATTERITNILLDAYAEWQAQQRVELRNALLPQQPDVAVLPPSSPRPSVVQ